MRALRKAKLDFIRLLVLSLLGRRRAALLQDNGFSQLVIREGHWQFTFKAEYRPTRKSREAEFEKLSNQKPGEDT